MKVADVTSLDSSGPVAMPVNLTWEGHEFIAAARSDTSARAISPFSGFHLGSLRRFLNRLLLFLIGLSLLGRNSNPQNRHLRASARTSSAQSGHFFRAGCSARTGNWWPQLSQNFGSPSWPVPHDGHLVKRHLVSEPIVTQLKRPAPAVAALDAVKEDRGALELPAARERPTQA